MLQHIPTHQKTLKSLYIIQQKRVSFSRNTSWKINHCKHTNFEFNTYSFLKNFIPNMAAAFGHERNR